MSHLHAITGQLDAADRYQMFLDRANAARFAREKEEIRKKSRVSVGAFDADREGREGQDGDPGQGDEKESLEEADLEDGFGKHYA